METKVVYQTNGFLPLIEMNGNSSTQESCNGFELKKIPGKS